MILDILLRTLQMSMAIITNNMRLLQMTDIFLAFIDWRKKTLRRKHLLCFWCTELWILLIVGSWHIMMRLLHMFSLTKDMMFGSVIKGATSSVELISGLTQIMIKRNTSTFPGKKWVTMMLQPSSNTWEKTLVYKISPGSAILRAQLKCSMPLLQITRSFSRIRSTYLWR